MDDLEPLADEISIKLEKVGLKRAVSSFLLRNMKTDVYLDPLSDHVIYEFSTKLPFVDGEEWIFVPVNWWEHLKKTLRKKFPKILKFLSYKEDAYSARQYMPNFPHQLAGNDSKFIWIRGDE